MANSPSRLPRDDHPPMSRALKRLMALTGTSGMELVRLLGDKASQSSVARYYSDREPDYQMAAEIERVLGFRPGTLFAMAGYSPAAAMTNSIYAIEHDPRLTDQQRHVLLFNAIQALRDHQLPTPPVDCAKAIANDPGLLEQDRRILLEYANTYLADQAVITGPATTKGTRKRERVVSGNSQV